MVQAQSVVERFAEVETIARTTESLSRTKAQLHKLTPLGVSDKVAAVLYPTSIVGAAQLVHRLSQAGIRWRALGQGVSFQGAPGLQDFVAVSLRLLGERVVIDGERVRVHAGYSIASLVRACAEGGLSGLEGLAGLPGSVGGALSTPNGLAIRYLWNLIEEVVVADRGGLVVIALSEAGESELFDPQDLILAVTLKLVPGVPEVVLAESERCRQARLMAAPYSVKTDVAQRPPHSSLWRRTIESGQNEEAALGEAFGLVELIRERVEKELKVQLAQVIQAPPGAAPKGISSDTRK
jgi:UDP-N-acetylmuramate dehydrogenase